jgi:hypothetical protein
MQTANTKQVRAIVSNYFKSTFTGNSWTDKTAKDDTLRRVAFKICGGSMEAERLETIRKDLQALFMLAGFGNIVTVTDSTSKRTREQILYCRDDSGCYVRIKALAS